MTESEREINELHIAGMYDEDSDYDGDIGRHVEELLKVFSTQGHTEMSAARTVEIFSKLADGGILIPLQGTPDEWVDISCIVSGENNVRFQNKRCSTVFAKSVNGDDAYDIHGKVFVPIGRAPYTNGKRSKVLVKFPYMPKIEYIVEGGNVLLRIKRYIKTVVKKW